jgi:hypothetical protein
MEELCSRPISLASTIYVLSISEVSSSPNPLGQVPDLNSPPHSLEGAREEQDPPNT